MLYHFVNQYGVQECEVSEWKQPKNVIQRVRSAQCVVQVERYREAISKEDLEYGNQ